MVFYLKYRPKSISDLDSAVLREKLESALKNKLPDDIPHAFLFTGSKGLGKTSTARIVAKAINCTNRKDSEIEPCNRCDSCLSIDSGSSLDVLEIDGASNRGIDEIRDLKEKIRLSPVSSKKKVYIIDEVHMLTTEAFNALLKTLEEPPRHAIFILCTTESHKLPETIVSRCFNIKFIRATDEDLVNSFERIVKGEKGKAEKEALIQIAKMSDGSFRDGAKIIEELFTYSNNIDSNLIEEKYKTKTISKQIDELIIAFEKRDAKEGIEIIAALSADNTDFKFFIESLINKLHLNLIERIEKREDIGEAKKLLELLIRSYSSIKYALLPQLPLELAIVEWCSEADIKPQLSSKEVGVELKTEKKVVTENKPSKSISGNDNILENLIKQIQKENVSVAGVLRGCKVESFNDGKLILSTSFAFHKEKLSDRRVVDIIEEVLESELKQKVKFGIVMKEVS